MPLIVVGAVLLICAAVLLGAWSVIPGISGRTVHMEYTYSDEVLHNPLTGFAYRAENTELLELGMQLVYIDLTWAEWEPEEGVFDTAGLEARNNIPFWRDHGLHAVLRFVCDMPGEKAHRDIPQWLYERTRDGESYHISYGRGYAPNYENPDFIEAHQKALAALGEYCSRDTFVSYVELGSLGHWGEWHVKTGEGLPPMPDQRICRRYVEQYVDSFPGAKLLARRPYAITVDKGIGVYNDMTGHEHDTLEWLNWQKEGGDYSYAGRTLPYRAVDAIWRTAPAGGEFTSSIPMEKMLDSHLETTLSLLEQSHMTFIGPKAPTATELALPGVDAVLKRLGYRYWISGADLRFRPSRDGVTLELTWENSGTAPLYFDWPVMLYVYDAEGGLSCSCRVNVDLRKLAEGAHAVSVTEIPIDSMPAGGTLGIGILDPMTGKPSVRLAMDVPCEDGIHSIGAF